MIVVNSAGDDPSGPTAGTVTLRDAINTANGDGASTVNSPDVIQFAIGSGPQTIHLGAALPTIQNPVVIDGSTQPGFTGTSLITVDGGGTYQLINNTSAALTINDLVLTGGNTTSDGGGLANVGTVTLNSCTFENNTAGGDGGALWNSGTITFSDCTFENNTANGNGGGISNQGTIEQGGGFIVINGNIAGVDGGGVYNNDIGAIKSLFDPAPLSQWTVQGNNAGLNGGGIANFGSSLTFDSTTISGNSALGTNSSVNPDGGDVGDGGGIYNFNNTLTFTNSTISDNHATGTGLDGAVGSTGGNGGCGGGIYDLDGTVTINGSTISGNSASGTGGAGGMGNSKSFFSDGRDGGDGGCGGGIYSNDDSVYITNGTVANNTAEGTGGQGGDSGTADSLGGLGGSGGTGAGIGSNFGDVYLTDVTVADNVVMGGTAGLGGQSGADSGSPAGDPGAGGTGGGLGTSNGENSGFFSLEDTIVAANTAPTGADIAAPGLQADYSLIGDGSGIDGSVFGMNGDPVGNQIGTADNPIDPKLGPLADNGGPTETLALLPGSPAIGAGVITADQANPSSQVTTDQRGVSRPAAADIGAFQTDGESQNQPPAFTSASNTTFTVGTLGSFTVTASGIPAPTLSEMAGDVLPAGVTFDPATGLLSGTPNAGTGGVYTLHFTATNVAGTDLQTFTLTVNEAPAFTSASNTTFTVGTQGSFTVTASGSPTPTLSESAGDTLPAGVTFNAATGVLSGTPNAGTGGVYTLHFTAHNGVGNDDTQSFTLTVNQAPAITSANNAAFTVGSQGSFTVTASGSPTPTLSESAGDTLPAGVTFNAATGVLSGTPAIGSSGVYTLHFTASNVVSTATQIFTLTVKSVPTQFTSFLSSASPSVPGQSVTFTATLDTVPPGGPSPTGSVDFFDQTTHTDLGTVTLVGGVAQLTTASLGALGNHTITATYTNADGRFVPPATPATLTQQVQEVVRESGGALFVGGTTASTNITVQLSSGQVVVNLHDGSPIFRTPLAGLTGLVVYGRANNEHIAVDSALTLPAFLFAGDGTNALIQGGGGPTVEVGGKGGAVLQGGTGRNILIAGQGGAHLEGGKADDILIAGYTDFDNNLPALQAILTEWNSSDSNAVRTAALSSYFNATTVHDDGMGDHLDSGGGQDWVFALLSGKQKNQLKGFNANDTMVGIH